MAVAQFTQQFLANLASINGTTVKEFYDNLLKTSATKRIDFLSATIDKQKDFLPKFDWSHGKDDEQSQHFRMAGIECFVRLEFVEALKYYNEAMAFAKSEENLGLCYANRSAVYYELSMYKICLENIQSALRYTQSASLTSKLEQRQQAAVAHLLSKLVLEPKRAYDIRLCRPPMQRQPFFINCLTKQSDQFYTEEPLLAGDVISLERPYSQVLSQSHIYERCTYCLTNKKYLSMIPCKHCSSAMFCNRYCYGMAKRIFHSFECSIIDGLFTFLPDSMYLGLRTVFIGLHECNGSIDEYRNMLRRCYDNDTDPFSVNATSARNGSFNEMIFLIIHNLSRSFTFSMQHHLATAVLMEKLKANFNATFDHNSSFETVLSTSIFHMIQVSMENSILLEETAFTSDDGGVGNDLTIYGCGLFPFASNVTLSCAPNVLFLNSNGALSGIVMRPIRAGEVIQPGIMSRNHFLTDIEFRTDRMQTHNSELCHCSACQEDFELFTELAPVISENHKTLSLIPETITNAKESAAAYKMICDYMNKNYKLPYLSWQMGWCIRTMIRVLRQLAETHGTDIVFTQYSKSRRNV